MRADSEAPDELSFVVEAAPEGGYTARAIGASIFTEADDLEGLRAMIADAARCHFGDEHVPPRILIHTVHSEQENQ